MIDHKEMIDSGKMIIKIAAETIETEIMEKEMMVATEENITIVSPERRETSNSILILTSDYTI